jgi:D-beta-D-heptose 7-phosphate kinase/D-beta-D-heptose 1-phosphate adenosyltransferase
MKPVEKQRLRRIVSTFPRARILVVGDLMLDRFIWGEVRRISPEAPVPVVRVTRESEHPGGAGNVVANLAALGAKPVVVGWVGRDAAGHTTTRLLRELGADASGILETTEAESIEKTRIIAHSQQVVRLDREARRPSAGLAKRLRAALERKLRGVDAVLVSDYGKGTIDGEILQLLAERRERQGFAYLIDPKQANFDAYRGATLVKPNEIEAASAVGLELDGADQIRVAGRRLLDRWQSESVLISRGEHGMTLFRRGAPDRSFPAAAREVFDVTGAGDTVMAVAALVLGVRGSLEQAALLANLAAGIVVGKVGTATLGKSELLGALDAAARQSSPPSAARRSSRAKSRTKERAR